MTIYEQMVAAYAQKHVTATQACSILWRHLFEAIS